MLENLILNAPNIEEVLRNANDNFDKKLSIQRDDITIAQAVSFQNVLAHYMAPAKLKDYLTHTEPDTKLEIDYANKWVEKYALNYNGLQSFFSSANSDLELKVKQNIKDDKHTDSDIKIVANFIMREEGPIFESDPEVDYFIRSHSN